MNKFLDKHFSLFITVAIFLAGGFLWSHTLLGYVNKSAKQTELSVNQKMTTLQKQIATFEEKLSELTGENRKTARSLKEVLNREVIRDKSQDELVTEAVKKVAPGVVSIVVTKNVPELEVVYKNVFGDDPFFKNFDIRVPVFRQKGITNKKVGAGTGFIVRSDGYIITNRHVVSDETASYTALLSDGTKKVAEVVYKDKTNDIAIVKITDTNLKTVLFGNSDLLKLGQTVIAIGNALGEYNNSVSIGIISGLNRSIEATNGNGTAEKLSGVIQTDAAVNPGNSGGPLVTADGLVVGVNVATVLGSSNVSFAIPINIVRSIIASVLGS